MHNKVFFSHCCIGLAKRVKAKVLIASTSEVYGDPEVHPQPETYWGHVNPIGQSTIHIIIHSQLQFSNLIVKNNYTL